MTETADYTLEPGERTPSPEEVAEAAVALALLNEPRPAKIVPAMTTKDITCSVRRVIQPRQYESWEVSMSVSVAPDPALTTGANLEKVHALLSAKVDWAVATWTERHRDGR